MAQNKRLSEDEHEKLLLCLQREEDDSLDFIDNEVVGSQIDALKAYYGELRGDEVEGQSSFVTRQVFETVEWLRPELRRIFTASHRIAEFEGTTAKDDEFASDAADYVNYVWFVENPGEQILDSFIFDGLVQRNGWLGVDWEKPVYACRHKVTGLTPQQLLEMQEDQNTVIEDVEVIEVPISDGYPEGLEVSCYVKEVRSEGKGRVFGIAPEDMRVSGKAADLEVIPYIGDIVRMLRGDAIATWPDYEDEIEATDGQVHSTMYASERRAQRFANEMSGFDNYGEGDNEVIEVLREFIRYDLDGDGYPEWVKVWRLDNQILEACSVKDHIYATWTPIPIAHRLFGLSVYDETGDIQDLMTDVQRASIDSLKKTINPRLLANEDTVDKDDLLVQAPGAVIPTRGHFQEGHVSPVPSNDMSKVGIEFMEAMNVMLETRTGVSRFTQGLNPDSLNHKTASGVEMLQNAAGIRKEFYARNCAMGLEVAVRKLFRTLIANQDKCKEIKVARGWINVDPREWNSDMRVFINVGLGTGNKAAQLAMYNIIQADQQGVAQVLGLDNPASSLPQMYNTLCDKVRAMGFRNPERYFGTIYNPDGSIWQPKPKPNPDVLIEQEKGRVAVEVEKVKQDANVQNFAAAEATKDKQATRDDRREDKKLLNDLDNTKYKIDREIELARYKFDQQLILDREKAEMDQQAKLEQIAAEFNLQVRVAEINAEKEKEIAEAETTELGEGDVRQGGKPG